MPVFNPITSARKLRRFGVIDLEWVPGEVLPPVVNTEVEVEGLRGHLTVPLPVVRKSTDPLQLRLAGYYDQQPEEDDAGQDEPEMVPRYCHYETVHELVTQVLTRDYRGMWFFAHAGGLADMQFVLDDLLAEIKAYASGREVLQRSSAAYDPAGRKTREEVVGTTWQIKASFSGSSAIIVHVVRGKNAWHFVDSYWLLRDSLASIGKAIGKKKGDDPRALAWMSERFGREVKDFEDLKRDEKRVFYADVPTDILVLYNQLDCEILWKAVAAFEDEIVGLGGQLQQTIASTAMSLFRRAFLKRDVFTSERLNEIAEQAYFASRVEVLSRNATAFKIYDINSSFPYAMTFPLPGNLVEYRTELPDDDADDCIYLADVTVEVPDMEVPPLPFRKDNRVFFPTGRWRSWFTSTDLRLALREGAHLHAVHEVYVFEPFHDFAEYARKIYALRAEAKTDFRRLVLKYLLNSLYGKCAESVHKQEMLINPDEVDRDTMQMLQPGVWLVEKEAVISHRHVVVAAVITAIARRTLYDYMRECYHQRRPVYYCDSVTGDRTVVLKSPEEEIVIEPVEEVWKRRGRGVRGAYHGDKETCTLGPGWRALAQDALGKQGWFPLSKLVRHYTTKDVHLVSSKRGQVGVTEDHSIMVGGKEVKPADFVRENMRFDVVEALPSEVRERVDLYHYLKHFRQEVSTDACHGGTIVHEFEVVEGGEWLRFRTMRSGGPLLKRFYRRGTDDFRRLLRVLAAFIAEGSSSVKGITTETRSMFSLSQDEEGWLLALRDDLEHITRDVEYTGPSFDEGSGVWYLRSGTMALPVIFGVLGGMLGSEDRHLPSFVYELDEESFEVFWAKLMEGDGSRERQKGGSEVYTTNSQKLAAGLSYLLSQHGREHSIHYRPSKHSYALRLRPDGSERRRWTTSSLVSRYVGYVYDLEVEGAHTFVDGVGRVLLHNTDSLATRARLPVDDKTLGALKLEKKMGWAEFVAPKVYRGEGFELKRDGTWEEKRLTKAKGFSLGRKQEAWDKLERIVAGDRVGVQRMTRLRELYRTVVRGQPATAPFEVLIVKALTFEMLSKRFHYPDGETRPWTVAELRSGDKFPGGFDFDAEIRNNFDFVTRSMLAAAV